MDWLEEDAEHYVFEESPLRWKRSDGNGVRLEWVNTLFDNDHIRYDPPAARESRVRAACWARDDKGGRRKALTKAEKLRHLAKWLDLYDTWRGETGNNGIQIDLRRWADEAEERKELK